MSTLDIYDPAQCCATGACGPDADDELAQFASALEGLKQGGVAVSRYNLGHQPGAFAQNAMVKETIQKEGIGCLPLVIADGRIVSKGRYPTRDELRAQAGMAAATPVAAKATSCCGPAKVTAAAVTAPAAVSAPGKPCCG